MVSFVIIIRFSSPAFSQIKAIEHSGILVPIFVLDPWFRDRVGALRYNHLIDSLLALNESLTKLGSGLLILEGSPEAVFEEILAEDEIKTLLFEKDTESFAVQRDAKVVEIAERKGVDVLAGWGHTLYDMDMLKDIAGASVPTTLASFQKLLGTHKVPKPLDAPQKMPALPNGISWVSETISKNPASSWSEKYKLALADDQRTLIVGGESIALAKMRAYLNNTERVTTFEKPKTNPVKAWYSSNEQEIEPGATTALSAYLHFGSLSARLFYWNLLEIEAKVKVSSRPPTSLVGQLLWREFFHFVGFVSPNFDRIEGNLICRQFEWKKNAPHLEAWRRAQTGFPWIDAIMTQLRTEGWIHHLARHCVVNTLSSLIYGFTDSRRLICTSIHY